MPDVSIDDYYTYTDFLSYFSCDEFDKAMEEFINEVINNNIKFCSKEANKIIQNIYENYINIININIDDPEIKLIPDYKKEVHDLYGGVTAWNFVNIPAPSYKNGMTFWAFYFLNIKAAILLISFQNIFI